MRIVSRSGFFIHNHPSRFKITKCLFIIIKRANKNAFVQYSKENGDEYKKK